MLTLPKRGNTAELDRLLREYEPQSADLPSSDHGVVSFEAIQVCGPALSKTLRNRLPKTPAVSMVSRV